MGGVAGTSREEKRGQRDGWRRGGCLVRCSNEGEVARRGALGEDQRRGVRVRVSVCGVYGKTVSGCVGAGVVGVVVRVRLSGAVRWGWRL